MDAEMYRCVKCGGPVRDVQPSTDSSARYATGMCWKCTRFVVDKVTGSTEERGRVGVTLHPVTPSPKRRKPKEQDPESLWDRHTP